MRERKPQPKQHRVVNRKPAFLAAFRVTLQLTAAAKAAGIDLSGHYRWLKEDPQYRVQYEQTRDQVAQKCEDVAIDHAVNGVKKAMYYRGKPVLRGKTRSHVYEVEYDHHLLLAVLRRLRPNDWRERVDMQAEVSGSINLIERLEAGRQRVLEMRRAEEGGSVANS
jgi:hypothetical protein